MEFSPVSFLVIDWTQRPQSVLFGLKIILQTKATVTLVFLVWLLRGMEIRFSINSYWIYKTRCGSGQSCIQQSACKPPTMLTANNTKEMENVKKTSADTVIDTCCYRNGNTVMLIQNVNGNKITGVKTSAGPWYRPNCWIFVRWKEVVSVQINLNYGSVYVMDELRNELVTYQILCRKIQKGLLIRSMFGLHQWMNFGQTADVCF